MGRGRGPADATPPLLVCCQESGHLLCKLSDDNHHLMAPERQRGPCVQRLWPLLQTAQCECTPPLPRDRSSLCSPASGPSYNLQLGLAWEAAAGSLVGQPRVPEGLPVRRLPLLWRWDPRGQGWQGTCTSVLGKVGGPGGLEGSGRRQAVQAFSGLETTWAVILCSLLS